MYNKTFNENLKCITNKKKKEIINVIEKEKNDE